MARGGKRSGSGRKRLPEQVLALRRVLTLEFQIALRRVEAGGERMEHMAAEIVDGLRRATQEETRK